MVIAIEPRRPVASDRLPLGARDAARFFPQVRSRKGRPAAQRSCKPSGTVCGGRPWFWLLREFRTAKQ